jgi:PAS domain S-box-containing protein
VTTADTAAGALAARRLGFLLDLGDELRRRTDPAGVTAAAAAALGRHVGAARAGYGEIDEAGEVVRVERDWTRDGAAVASLAGEARVLDAFGPAVIAELKAGRTLVVEDCRADPRAGEAFAATWDGIGCRSLVVVPLVRGGRLRAILYLHEPAPRRWSGAEVALAEDVADRTWDAHQRALSERALRESEERYRTLFGAMDEGYLLADVLFDEQGRSADIFCVEANPAAARMVGQDPTGQRLSEIDPGFERHWYEIWGRVARTGEAARLERHAGPLKAWFDFYVFKPEPRNTGSRRVAVVFRDVTERRRAEAALRESEARFRGVADSAPVLVWMSGEDKGGVWFNRAWLEFRGRALEQELGAGWLEGIHPDDTPALDACMRAFEARRPFRTEFRMRRRDGAWRWMLDTGVPRFGPAGAFLGYIGSCLDVTERREAEDRLRESQARFRHMADSAPALIWMTDAEGRVAFANLHHDHVFGRPAAEMHGGGWRRVVDPADLGGFQAAFRAAFAARLPFRAEVRVRDKRGEVRWVRCEGVPRLDDAGAFLGYTGCGLDVTDAKAAEAELRLLTGTLEQRVEAEVAERAKAEAALRQAQKMEAIGQLTGGVAHDLNNLLTVIRSSTDLLRRPDLPEERRRYVDAIAATVDRAAKITGQLLAFARRQALKPEVFEVAARVGAVADLLRTVAGPRVRIEARAPRGRCFAEADASQFETALVNMAANARDAMGGEGTLTVRVEGVAGMPPIRGHGGAPGGFVAVSVSDTGSGIPPDELPRVFEPFFTTKEVGKGTGLGLSQVYGLAKQSGGDVAVESQVGRGTTFTLYLPRVEGEGTGGAAVEDATAPRPAPGGGGRRVLVVEDNAEVGAFSTQVLQDLGYETIWASSGAEALALLEDGPARFDVVFSDVVMPGMGGVELGREIRRRHPGLPVVLTSGYSHVLAEEGRHAFELLHKPYAAEELSRVLRRVARVRGAR